MIKFFSDFEFFEIFEITYPATILLFLKIALCWKMLFVKCSFKALNISSKVIYCSLLEVVLNRL